MKNRLLVYRAMLTVLIFSLTSGSSWATLADLLRAQGYYEGKVFRKGGGDADFIKVEINGQPLTLLIDTGQDSTLISRKAAERAGLLTGRDIGSVHGINGDADAHGALAQISSFRIGGVELAPSRVVIASTKTEMEEDGIDFDGLLGLMTMKANHVVFGYHPAVFYFQPGGRATRGMDAFLLSNGFSRVSLMTRKAAYLLPVSLDGTPTIMLLGSGAEHTQISEDLANRANLRVDSRTRLIVEGIDGHDRASEIVVPRKVSTGTFQFPPLPMVAANLAMFVKPPDDIPLTDGILGFDLVGHLYSVLDTTHDYLYLRPLPH